MRYLLLASALALCACNESKSSSAASAPKSIFSEWAATGVPGTFSYEGGEFGVTFTSRYYEICEYDALIEGDELEGTITYSNGVYTGAGADTGLCDPQEAHPWDYSKNGNTLSICHNGNCEEFN